MSLRPNRKTVADLQPFLAPHLRRRREKVFGDGPRLPLDRNAKVRIMHLARVLMRRTEPGQHYGALTAKYVQILHALLWLIHDSRSGWCSPGYEHIADKAACARSTVAEAIKALELVGLLSWVNRITRIREREVDLFGRAVWCWKVVRTSNAYTFRDPKPAVTAGFVSKSDYQSGPIEEVKKQLELRPLDPDSELGQALASYGIAAGFALS